MLATADSSDPFLELLSDQLSVAIVRAAYTNYFARLSFLLRHNDTTIVEY